MLTGNDSLTAKLNLKGRYSFIIYIHDPKHITYLSMK